MTRRNPSPGPLVGPEDVPAWLAPLVRASGELDAATLHRTGAPDEADGLREAAVLVLFGERSPENPDVLLLRRADGLSSHPGQVGFPGGGIDGDDCGPVSAAVREAGEECGVDAAGVRPVAVWPRLFVPPSGFLVTPVIAHWLAPVPVQVVDVGETAAVARVPVDRLVDPENRLVVRLASGHATPAFVVPGMLVWGFTGGLLSGLLDVAGWARPWNAVEYSLEDAWRIARDLDDVADFS